MCIRDSGSVWAHAGRWISDLVEDPVFGAGAMVELLDRYAVRVSVDQETNDPLYWSTPRRIWNVALSRSIGPAPRRGSGSGAPPPPQISAAEVTIRLPATAAEQPSVAGDFSNWEPVSMRRAGGEWVATFRLEPGVYRYAFRRADGSWFVPRDAPGRTDDGFGGESIVLVVR